MNQILHTDNAVLAEVVLNDLVVGQSNSLLVDFTVTAFVDELSDRFEVGVSVGDIWVDDGQHFLRGLRELDKDTIVDLEESEKLEDLSWLGGNLVDTLDSDNKDKLGLLIDVEGTVLSAQASESNLLSLCVTVFLHIRFGALKDDTSLLLVGL